MKKTGWLLIFLCMMGCSSEKDLSPAEAQILGRWQLTEFCVSPGDGTCPRQTTTPATAQVLDFRDNGSFLENRPQPGRSQAPITNSGEYRLEAPDAIYFKFDAFNFGGNGVSAPPTPPEVKWSYTLTRDLLILSPPCREACAYTYKRI